MKDTPRTTLPQKFLEKDLSSLYEFTHLCADNGTDVIYGHDAQVVHATEFFIDYTLVISVHLNNI